MYIGDLHLHDLEMLIIGYGMALDQHAIFDDVPNFNKDFNSFVYDTTSWSTSCGWAEAISSHAIDKRAALAKFFELYEAFLDFRERVEIVDPV